MQQAIHIFRKDVRHLWLELSAVLFLTAAFCFVGARRSLALDVPGTERTAAWALVTFLLPLSWWILIARLIHDEALPGDSQFWITRPYNRKSLLGAKLLFILCFTNLPILISDAVILNAYHLAPFAELPGLLWSQVLLTIVFLLPIVVLSALTTGFVQLLVAILVAWLAGLVVTIAAPDLVLALPSGYGWINAYFAFIVIGLAAVVILIWQYRRRGTAAGRAFAVMAGVLILAGAVFFPWSDAFRIQSWLSNTRVSQSAVQASPDSQKNWLDRAEVQGDGSLHLELPIAITRLPLGMVAKVEGFSLQLRAPDGTAREVRQLPLNHPSEVNQEFSVTATLDRGFYQKVKDEPLAVRGRLYLTLFGNRHVARVPFSNRFVRVPNVGECEASQVPGKRSYFVICNSAFRAPPVLTSVRFIETSANSAFPGLTPGSPPAGISYSPLPAEPGIDPVSQAISLSPPAISLSPNSSDITGAVVDTQEPLIHLERTFELGNLRLRDLEQRGLSASR
ncbi:MAG: hypothetical protein ACRD5K_01130 [Candidatus Acidiferrales bacterium]